MTDTQVNLSSTVAGARTRIEEFLSRYKGAVTLVMIGVVSLVGVLLNSLGPGEPATLTERDVRSIAIELMASATPRPAISAQIYEAILPSLVMVQATHQEENEFELGGGVIINEDGLILTSLHLVAEATEIRVSFYDGTSTLAILQDQETEKDIALLAPDISPPLVVPIVIGRSSSVKIGDETYVVGNPLGLMGSMTAGIVSGLDRTMELSGVDQPLEGLIQFDAAVNLGSSGSPLLNTKGQLIGIVAGLLSSSDQEAFIGIGFAVPIDIAASAVGGPSY
jgi:S1-C subfamily serine protease